MPWVALPLTISNKNAAYSPVLVEVTTAFINCEIIKDLLLPTPPRTWRRRAGGQLKTWATTIKADLEPISRPRVFGHARWRKDWVKVSSELGQDRRAWSASVRDVVNAINKCCCHFNQNR